MRSRCPRRYSTRVLLPFLLASVAALPSAAAAQRTGQVQRPVTRTPGEPAFVTVTARQTGPTEITVRWNAVPGATGYQVGRLAPPDGWRRVDVPTPAATQYVDRDVEVGRSYTYQVVPVLRNGAGGRFRSDSVRVEAGVVPGGGDQGADAPTESAAEPETRAEMLQRVYEGGSSRFRWWTAGERQGKSFWLRTAEVSGFDEATLRARWGEIAQAAQLYQHIFRRPPTQVELQRQLAAQRAGVAYEERWRQLAQSAQREKEHGAWAAAPMTLEQARGVFGWRNNRPGEQCFGGMGPRCAGEIPKEVEWVQPRWHDHFDLPDGTRMAYVEIGVGIGSIVHDNACMEHPTGIACNGWVPIADYSKHSGLPAAMEWNKAGWNAMQGRGWRHRFGPYPVDPAPRRRWYDDLRTVPARRAMMAKSLGPFTTPVQDQPYRGLERKASRVLSAPSGTRLESGDGAFCADRRGFKNVEYPFGTAPVGICW